MCAHVWLRARYVCISNLSDPVSRGAFLNACVAACVSAVGVEQTRAGHIEKLSPGNYILSSIHKVVGEKNV